MSRFVGEFCQNMPEVMVAKIRPNVLPWWRYITGDITEFKSSVSLSLSSLRVRLIFRSKALALLCFLPAANTFRRTSLTWHHLQELDACLLSKTALLALNKILSQQLGPRNIRVNAIAPGLIKTKLSIAVSNWDSLWAKRPQGLWAPGGVQPGDILRGI